MEYIFQSTLSTLTGLLVIGSWCYIGQWAAQIWLNLYKFELLPKVILGTIGGPITLVCVLLIAITQKIRFKHRKHGA